jgi:UDP-glucuronate decarboxylase
MRILVTGSAGFVGSHLSRKLLNMGHEVLGVDNFYTGSRSNVTDLLSNPNFELVRHDVTMPLYVEVDAVMNLACPASPVHYQRHPVQTSKTSIMGAINMLGLAKRLNIPILQASTSEVYGDPTISPQTESYWGNVNPIGIRSCYDEGKRVAETLFFDYHRQYGTKIQIVRIFNTYGPSMNLEDGRVVSNFIYQALLNQDLTVYGDGLQTRSFCFISDLVEALVKFVESKDVPTGPINLGNPREFTILELAEKVISAVGSKSKIIHSPLPMDDPKQRKPDISVAKEILNWTPEIELEEGLSLTINDFEKRMRKLNLI